VRGEVVDGAVDALGLVGDEVQAVLGRRGAGGGLGGDAVGEVRVQLLGARRLA